jgi:hypothetical protein
LGGLLEVRCEPTEFFRVAITIIILVGIIDVVVVVAVVVVPARLLFRSGGGYEE